MKNKGSTILYTSTLPVIHVYPKSIFLVSSEIIANTNHTNFLGNCSTLVLKRLEDHKTFISHVFLFQIRIICRKCHYSIAKVQR